MNTENLNITEQELEEFKEFKRKRDQKEQEIKLSMERSIYKDLIEQTVDDVFPKIEELSQSLSRHKKDIYDAFKAALELKGKLYEKCSENRSHAFINKDKNRRITLGNYVTDAYDDTVEEGIAQVKSAITSLAKDADSAILVDAIMKLMARDHRGNIKASRVMQLWQLAENSGIPEFIDGVKIIREAYRPAETAQFIRAEYKNSLGRWVTLPLGITESSPDRDRPE